MATQEEALSFVFGNPGNGVDMIDCAMDSLNSFSVTEYHLMRANPNSKGFLLSAADALASYGWEKLSELCDHSSIPILVDAGQPQKNFSQISNDTQIDIDNFLSRSGFSDGEILQYYSHNQVPIRKLDRLAQLLGISLNEIGKDLDFFATRPSARMRSLAAEKKFTLEAKQVELMLEAIRVASDYRHLYGVFSRRVAAAKPYVMSFSQLSDLQNWSSEYSNLRPWEQGYALAQNLRMHCGFSASVPLHGISKIVEQRFNLPLMFVHAGKSFSGFTVQKGAARAICVNKDAFGYDVFSQRATVAHELCHALFDSDDQVGAIRVDQDRLFDNNILEVDSVEQRANAFAAEFLAPRKIVGEKFLASGGNELALRRIASQFGVSLVLARWQLKNSGVVESVEYLDGTSAKGFHPGTHFDPDVYSSWTGKEFTIGEIVFSNTAIGDIRKNISSVYAISLFHNKLISQDRLDSVLGWSGVDISKVTRSTKRHFPNHFDLVGVPSRMNT